MSEKYLRVTMPDGSKWDVPAKFIAEDRAHYYAKRDASKRPVMTPEQFAEVFAEEVKYCIENDYELKYWAENNMNWIDVTHLATMVPTVPPKVDYQEGWVNGPKEVVER